ncbi:MAG: hypothetical protein OHK93_008742 [Ramalina farinacea]|uniref:uracil phosphoribosyltransferase n=1 Tax=Ramalina farinacea TaxID=258253 RepID=A0AA43QN13_9LECA|nr:hypothetical protein [Ramalina farinacea]
MAALGQELKKLSRTICLIMDRVSGVEAGMESLDATLYFHLSTHPCLLAKLSQLRSSRTTARDTKSLVHEITLILACAALSTALTPISSGQEDITPLNHPYIPTTTTPSLALVPILRSGLAMLDALQLLLPTAVPVHHLGLYREPSTLQPVEYYNNLPYHAPPPHAHTNTGVPEIAILLDPIIATGGTSAAAIQTLLEWGVRKVVVVAVLGTVEGVGRAAGVVAEGGWGGGGEGGGGLGWGGG